MAAVEDKDKTAALVSEARQAQEALLRHIDPEHNAHGHPWTLKHEIRPADNGIHLKVYDSEEPNSRIRRFKAVCEMRHAPEDVFRGISTPELRMQWDGTLDSISVDALPGGKISAAEELVVYYCRTKAVFGVSSRDFVDLTLVTEEGSRIISGGTGLGEEGDRRYPPINGVIRGSNASGGGWVIEATESGGCRVHYVIHSDLKGWLPIAIINRAMVSQYVDFFTRLDTYLSEAKSKAMTSGSGKAAA